MFKFGASNVVHVPRSFLNNWLSCVSVGHWHSRWESMPDTRDAQNPDLTENFEKRKGEKD